MLLLAVERPESDFGPLVNKGQLCLIYGKLPSSQEEPHLNKQKIEYNLNVPGAKESQENTLLKYFLQSEMILQMTIKWANENQLKIWFI